MLTRIRAFSPANRYGVVLVLIVITYITSVSARGATAQAIVVLIQLLTVWLVFGVSESRRARRVAGAVLIAGAVFTLVGLIVGSVGDVDNVIRALSIVSTLLYLVAPVVIVRHIFGRTDVDGQTLLGAIAAYLLLGMMFAFFYRAIGTIQTSPPFFGDQGPGTASQSLYFSFVTLTTTGYGNLVPAGNPGQTVSVAEAIVGQLFLVTAVAKIIAAWRTKAERREADDPFVSEPSEDADG